MDFQRRIKCKRVSQRDLILSIVYKLIDGCMLIFAVIIVNHDAMNNTIGCINSEKSTEVTVAMGDDDKNSLPQ